MILQKNLENKKDRAPPNYVERIRSNLNFEVILKVKKAKKQNREKKQNRFLGFLAKILVTMG